MLSQVAFGNSNYVTNKRQIGIPTKIFRTLVSSKMAVGGNDVRRLFLSKK